MILNTRPGIYRERFRQAFAGIGLPILDCPLLTAEATEAGVPPSAEYDAVIFTSQIGVSVFPAQPEWQSKKVYAVGSGTAEAARLAGFADVTCTGVDASGMEQYLATEPFRHALYASAEEVSKDLSDSFPGRVRRIAVYRMIPVGALPDEVWAAIKGNRQIIAPLFSRRSAAVLEGLFEQADITSGNARVGAVGISNDVFAAGKGPWHCRAVASQPTLEAMAAKTRELADDMELMPKVM